MARLAWPPGVVRGRGRAEPATWVHRGVLAVLVLFSFLQHPGDTTFDTKFDLTADPGRFLERTFHLWNPWQNFGELQNQAYGYLFPQGLWFLSWEGLGLPDWVAQRAWSALVLCVGYEGCRRLHRALVPGRPWLSVIAGAAYATAPRLLALSGVLSAEVLPTAVLPWVALPLVLGLRGDLKPLAAGVLSAVPVLFMGGVNAVEVLAALPLPFLLVVSGVRTPHGRRLAGWWTLATTAACLWWFLPLLVMGRYSPPFLDYIETAMATTRPLGWANVVRGADHWLAFIVVGGRPWWPAAYDLATEPVLVLATATVAAVSAGGLCSRAMPKRLVFAGSALLGLVLMTVGHAGFGAAPAAGVVRELLDGPLAVLRNVHKVDPLVRLPFALGFATAVGQAPRALRHLRRFVPTEARRRSFVVPVVTAVALALLAASATPLFTNGLRKPGWTRVPDAWEQAGAFLADHEGAALVVPGSGFGLQYWGWTIDQPIQGVATSAWALRGQVPLVPGPTVRYLDSLEGPLDEGVGSDALADSMAQGGLQWLVVRRDLDVFAADVPAPNRIDAAVAHTPGLTHAKSFGRSGFGDQPMIDIYRVNRKAHGADAPLRSTMPTVAGDPGDLLTARELGLIDPRAAVTFSADAPDVVLDGFRRQERQFGRLQDALGEVMTADQPYRGERSAYDYAGVPGQRRVVARYTGVADVSASSSAGYADAFGPIRPEVGPASAVDGDPTTYWQSAPFEKPEGQWLQLDFRKPVTANAVGIRAGVDTISGVPIRRLRVTAGNQTRVVGVDPVTGRVRVPLDGSPFSRLRITVVEVEGSPDQGVVALRGVHVHGHAIRRDLVVPDVHADAETAFGFHALPARRACVPTAFGPSCAQEDFRARLEQLEMRRVFSVDEPTSYRLHGRVVARPTPDTAVLLNPIGPGISATASSTLANDPLVSARFAVDGDPLTPWIADPSDAQPRLVLSWGERRRLSRIQVLQARGDVARPTRLVLTADGQTRVVQLGLGGIGTFRPLRASQVTLELIRDRVPAARPQPMAVGEIRLRGVQDLVRPVVRSDPTGAVCGLGPEVTVDGRTFPTRVEGTVEDVLDGTPLAWRACGRADPKVRPGRHHVTAVATTQFSPTMLALDPPDRPRPAPEQRAVETTSWSSVHRVYDIADGADAVLRIGDNLNPGWHATLAGQQLRPIAVDGWQQGFEVPAGAGGKVTVDYSPDRWYRAALALGALAGLALLLLTAWALWRGVRTPTERSSAAAAHPAQHAAARVVSPQRRAVVAAAGLLVLVLGGVLGGPFLAVGLAVGLVALVVPRARPWVLVTGAVLVGVSGLVAAVFSDGTVGGALPVSDALAAGAVGLLTTSVLVDSLTRGGSHG